MIAKLTKAAVSFTLVLLFGSATAEELAPIEAYGALPTVGMMQLSPEGTRTASRVSVGDRDIIVARDVETRQFVGAADAERLQPIAYSESPIANQQWQFFLGKSAPGYVDDRLSV